MTRALPRWSSWRARWWIWEFHTGTLPADPGCSRPKLLESSGMLAGDPDAACDAVISRMCSAETGIPAATTATMWVRSVADADAFAAFEEAGNCRTRKLLHGWSVTSWSAGGVRGRRGAVSEVQGRMPGVEALLEGAWPVGRCIGARLGACSDLESPSRRWRIWWRWPWPMRLRCRSAELEHEERSAVYGPFRWLPWRPAGS